MERKGGGGGEEVGQGGLEDTLKASEQTRRGQSSPPGISCERKEEEGEEGDVVHPLASSVDAGAVQLRAKVPASRSMDTIKVYTTTS